MKLITINDSIVSYTDFIAELLHDKRTVSFQKKYEAFVSFYDQFKANMDLLNFLQNFKSSNPKISAFHYSEIEQVLAYIHLMLEIFLNRKIEIMNSDELFQNIPSIQDCLARLWQEDTVENQNYIILYKSDGISRIHQVDEKKLAEDLEIIRRIIIHASNSLGDSTTMRPTPMRYNEKKHRWEYM